MKIRTRLNSFLSSASYKTCAVVGTVAGGALVASQSAFATDTLDPSTALNIDMSSYATDMGTKLGEIVGAVIVIGLCFVLVRKGYNALAGRYIKG